MRPGERSYFLANAKNDDDVARASSSNFDPSPNTYYYCSTMAMRGQNLYKFLFEFTYTRAIRVVEISNGGYKIRKIFA